MSEKRLIDANALPNYKCQTTVEIGDAKGPAEIRIVFWEDIVNAPTIDAVEVVRCRECKHHRNGSCPMRSLDVNAGGRLYVVDQTDDDGFCHMGAKMDGGAEDV